MKTFTLALLICCSRFSMGQPSYNIDIQLGQLTCRFRNDLRPSSEAAFKLMSMVYNSKEFQDSVSKLSFPDNSCNACGIERSLSGDSKLDNHKVNLHSYEPNQIKHKYKDNIENSKSSKFQH